MTWLLIILDSLLPAMPAQRSAAFGASLAGGAAWRTI
jgi:hypothetical protein